MKTIDRLGKFETMAVLEWSVKVQTIGSISSHDWNRKSMFGNRKFLTTVAFINMQILQ